MSHMSFDFWRTCFPCFTNARGHGAPSVKVDTSLSTAPLTISANRPQVEISVSEDILGNRPEGGQLAGTSQLNSIEALQLFMGRHPNVKRLDGEVVKLGVVPVTGGIYSDIWLGHWFGEKVALKTLRNIKASDKKAMKRFDHEFDVWGKLQHDHILSFYGAVTSLDRYFYMVSPWQENGNCLEYVTSRTDANKIHLLWGAACGLEYLHSRRYIHGNIQCANILISSYGEALVCDFGMSKLIEEEEEEDSKSASASLVAAGSARWLAPELIEGSVSSRTFASDTYTFAMAILELLTEKHPFAYFRRDASVIHHVVVLKLNPTRPVGDAVQPWLTDELWDLMRECWDYETSQRPPMTRVLDRLHKIGSAIGVSRNPIVMNAVGRNVFTPSSTELISKVIDHPRPIPTRNGQAQVCETEGSNRRLDSRGTGSESQTTFDPSESSPRRLEEIRDQIVAGVRDSQAMTEADKVECLGLVSEMSIFKLFVLYTLIHVRLCAKQTSQYTILKSILPTWKGLDQVTSLTKYRSISDCLHEFLKLCTNPSANGHLCDAGDQLEALVGFDIIDVSKQLAIMMDDTDKRSDLLALRGEDAQFLLNLLQALLDFPYLEPPSKRPLIKALVLLSRMYGLYPECLVLRHVEMTETHPKAAGSFGDVWKGTILGHTVAFKVLKMHKESDMEKLLEEFSREAVIWRQLSHTNVLPFYGVYHLDGPHSRVCLLSPWMENGTIMHYLERAPNTDRIPLVLDVALGLEYLHNLDPTIIHGDLKGANILITQSCRACLADFGMATVRDTGPNWTNAGTYRYRAPELLSHGENQPQTSLATDVYAFACVCYEVFSGKIPFYEIRNDFRVGMDVLDGKRPPRPEQEICDTRGLDDDIWAVITSCWEMIDTDRPTTNDIVQRLRNRAHYIIDTRPINEWDEKFVEQLRSAIGGHPILRY